MKYVKVEWTHNSPDNPIVIYSELDNSDWEIRKVHVLRSGAMEFASEDEASSTTLLSTVPFLPNAEISSQPNLKAHDISKEEFEEMWSKATNRKL